MDPLPKQRIRYLRTDDGVRLAWAEAGSGPPLVKAAHWLSHLQYEWESPVWPHWLRFLATHFRFIRYDERGTGMSDCEVAEPKLERSTADLEAVIAAAAVGERFVLLGISHGAAAAVDFAVRHPERVSRLVLYGAPAQGVMIAAAEDAKRRYLAMRELLLHGWAGDNATFRQLFVAGFCPDADDELLAALKKLSREAISPSNLERVLASRGSLDVTELLSRVRVPTLVLHARGDRLVPLKQGQLVAATIPDAEFVELDSRNHILQANEPAWQRFCEAVLDFVGVAPPPPAEDRAFATLSPREREVLALLAAGLGNAAIGSRLAISEKTVRNHVSHVFDKLGVWTRAQAIVFARDRGFGG